MLKRYTARKVIMNKSSSPSKTYVAMCSKPNFAGYYFRKFVLPDDMPNNTEMASWYFLNILDFFSCIDGCIAFEDFSNIKDAQKEDPEMEEIKNET